MSGGGTPGEEEAGEQETAGRDGAAGVAGDRVDIGADEEALLAAFDRLSPQGTLQWGFDDAMRRIADPETDATVAPWPGLPDDLWQRGRSARIGQRFVGDVAGVLAELMAADARAAAATAAAGVNVATWDALRYLAARVDALEAARDPVGLETAELPFDRPDIAGWTGTIATVLGPPDPDAPVIVGECGDGSVFSELPGPGRRVEGVEPRASSAWAGLSSDGDGPGRRPGARIVLAEVLDHLRTVPTGVSAGVVLAGCVDRLGLAGQVELVHQAVRVTRAGAPVVVLATDQSAWDEALDPPARDLAPGRPLHPTTWSLLFRHSGLVDVEWQRPGSGVLHAVIGRVP